MRHIFFVVIFSLVSCHLYSQGYIQIDTIKYHNLLGKNIDGLNLDLRGSKLVEVYDSLSGHLISPLSILHSNNGQDDIICLVKIIDSEYGDRNRIMIDQFKINSNLKYLYFNNTGCSSDVRTFGAFSIQGGNSKNNEVVLLFSVDVVNDKFIEQASDNVQCDSEPRHTIRHD